MPPSKNEIGNRYGNLIVVEKVPAPHGHQYAWWKCKCDCGNEIITKGTSLRVGDAKSCGCRHKHHEYLVKNEVGNRYGKLVVIKRDYSDASAKNANWICKCDCGNSKIVKGEHLRAGMVKSCGCLATLPFGEGAFNTVYGHIKNNARVRNYEFSLSKEYVRKLTSKNCYYCGKPPSQVCHIPKGNGDYIYNGLDRIDSTKGYIVGNVVPCCGTCNWMKMSLSLKEFKKAIKNIYKHLIK